MSQPVKIFIAYSRKDSEMRKALFAHMNALLISKKVEKIWCDEHIEPAAFWEEEIEKELNTANIILLLLSADALNSDYFVHKEMPAALKRHYEGKAEVIPIILRACAWQDLPIAKIQVLPRSGKAIESHEKPDEALAEIVKEIAKKIALRSSKKEPAKPVLEDLKAKAKRMLAQSKFEELFELLGNNIRPDSEAANDITLQHAAYNRTFRDEIACFISREDARLEYAKVTRALGVLINNLQREDLHKTGV